MGTVMPTASSITSSSVIIQQSLDAKVSTLNADSTKVEPLKPNLGDLVEISKLATEKQQQAIQLETSKQIKEIAIDVVRVSSTIGRARSSDGLTNSQATDLYQKIAKLL